jgi:hypothetical protein
MRHEIISWIREIREVTLSLPYLWASFQPLNPFLVVSVKQGNFIKSQYEMSKLSAKCWISAFNAQGSRGITLAVQVGAVKIYVAVVEALRHKKKTVWKSGNPQNWWFPEFHSPWNADELSCRFFGISPCVWPNSGYWDCLFLTLRISMVLQILMKVM